MKLEARTLKNFHMCAMIVWILLAIPSIIWWKESVFWVIIMSIWANFAGHFAAWQGARGECAQEKKEEDL